MKHLTILGLLIVTAAQLTGIGTTEASGIDAPMSVMSIDCPRAIDIGIVNAPPGWSPIIAPGAAKVPFQRATVDEENGKADIACFYSLQKGQFSSHYLHRTMPADYVCSVDPGQDSEGHRRTITCLQKSMQRTPTKPVGIGRKNE